MKLQFIPRKKNSTNLTNEKNQNPREVLTSNQKFFPHTWVCCSKFKSSNPTSLPADASFMWAKVTPTLHCVVVRMKDLPSIILLTGYKPMWHPSIPIIIWCFPHLLFISLNHKYLQIFGSYTTPHHSTLNPTLMYWVNYSLLFYFHTSNCFLLLFSIWFKPHDSLHHFLKFFRSL